MNMHAIFLHALGDALGNVGVIAAGLLIWFIPVTRQAGRIVGNRWVLFADPGISLIITAIIFTSAIPLGSCYDDSHFLYHNAPSLTVLLMNAP